jgi:hypothetical protein
MSENEAIILNRIEKIPTWLAEMTHGWSEVYRSANYLEIKNLIFIWLNANLIIVFHVCSKNTVIVLKKWTQ